MENIKKYMNLALEQAKKADINEEIPVGVIIVKDGKVISKAYNKKEKYNDATKHAEIIAIQKAAKKLGDWRLNDCVLFVSLEPCLMCMGAIVESRIKTVFCGTKNIKCHDINKKIANTNKISLKMGFLEKECNEIIINFFDKKRKK